MLRKNLKVQNWCLNCTSKWITIKLSRVKAKASEVNKTLLQDLKRELKANYERGERS